MSTIQTSMGKYFMRNFEETMDAQSVWKEYKKYMETSMKYDLQIE